MRNLFFEGVTTAIVTPFKNGEIDYSSLKKLIRFQLDEGIAGFVVAGSTGEAATLSLEEKGQLLGFVQAEVSSQVPIIVGSGTFNTKESCELAQYFAKYNPQGLLVVTPYYNKPPQRALYEHYMKISQTTDLPIIIYNVPGRTAVKIEPETVMKLAKSSSRFYGIKEAAGDLKVMSELIKKAPKDFMILSGDDPTCFDAMAAGGHGVISVISHVAPSWCVSKARFSREVSKKKKLSPQDQKELKSIRQTAIKISNAMFCESNPIPVKWALKHMGIIESSELRLPLVELDKKFQSSVKKMLKEVAI